MNLLDIVAGFAWGLGAGDRAHHYDDASRYDGTVSGRGDGGFDLTDRDGRFAGSVKPAVGSDGFDVFDGEGRYRGTLKP